jgi:D-glycero-beta-D-manno-heptose 1-phosphate adenylyltransferase
MTSEKNKNSKELNGIISNLKEKGKRIVSTNGVFDILHIGHVRYLQEAKSMGDILIVAMNSDSSVRKIKGPKRPINNENDRVETDPRILLDSIKPDIHVKANDYKISEIIERSIVEKNNGKVVLASKVVGYSTTALIDKIMESR